MTEDEETRASEEEPTVSNKPGRGPAPGTATAGPAPWSAEGGEPTLSGEELTSEEKRWPYRGQAQEEEERGRSSR